MAHYYNGRTLQIQMFIPQAIVRLMFKRPAIKKSINSSLDRSNLISICELENEDLGLETQGNEQDSENQTPLQ